ncbi:MAG TPA: diaminopimelate decarboxylase [Candidatus Saccharimonadales bacterium]|nr:diaminopimelate decarboxylase [Candidatus Saccharimonadales bacterium]
MSKELPFDENKLREIASKYPTPFHLYDEAGIRKTAKALNGCFDWSDNYINYFAVKATPNPYIMQILKEEGMGADASSLPELLLAEAAGLSGEQIMFTSNNTPPEEYKKAYGLGAVINLDDINQIDVLQKSLDGKFPEFISFRYNPGPDRVTDEKNVIGNPEDAKYGVTTTQLPEAYDKARSLGAKRFGLHTMVVSNERNEEGHLQTAEMLFNMAVKLKNEKDIKIEMINFGGGLGIPMRPEEQPIDLDKLKAGVRQKYEQIIAKNGLDPIRLVTENGRYVTGPNGYLVTTVRSLKHTYHDYAGVDATMADMMRVGMYGAYHHISVPGKEDGPRKPQRVTGSLCENNDTFTGKEDRLLPELEPGDLVVIHDTGAHGHAMGFNYNGKLRHAELLLREDGSIQQIRRAETVADYFKTLDFPGLKDA